MPTNKLTRTDPTEPTDAAVVADEQPTLLRLMVLNGRLIEADPAARFPGSRPMYWYDSKLEGIPFTFAGQPTWGEKDSAFNRDQKQEYCRVAIRLFDDNMHRMATVEHAEFTGRYTLNSIRALHERWAQVGDVVYTLARDPSSEVNKTTGKRSLNLALYMPDDAAGSENGGTFDVPTRWDGTSVIPDLTAFLSYAQAIHQVYRDPRKVMEALGVRTLVGVSYPKALETLDRLHKIPAQRARP